MVRLGWHPLLRSATGATVRPVGQSQWSWLRDRRSADGRPRRLHGTWFNDPASHLTGTLLVWYDDQDPDPWFVITDLAPDTSDIAWDGLRAWCEQGVMPTLGVY